MPFALQYFYVLDISPQLVSDLEYINFASTRLYACSCLSVTFVLGVLFLSMDRECIQDKTAFIVIDQTKESSRFTRVQKK